MFRRFPTRDDLVAAAFAEKMNAYVSAIDEAARPLPAPPTHRQMIEHSCA
ncbi:hypothetical protein LRP67_00120 [Nocardioides sp. cx-169]|nr:hypothetical protein [Nocardioides sp. cx-169]MCD4532496.1 hypothetical protein [Nocardioides sp. cx-169]